MSELSVDLPPSLPAYRDTRELNPGRHLLAKLFFFLLCPTVLVYPLIDSQLSPPLPDLLFGLSTNHNISVVQPRG
jgi:hypothetical protein